MTKTISFVSSKGGTGKTTTIYNMLHVLKSDGKKILLLDLDEQGNLSEMFAEQFDNWTHSVKSIFTHNRPANEIVCKIDDSTSIVFADLELGIFKNDLQTKSNKDYLLLRWFHDNKQFLSSFDYILIDLHPEISTITLNAFLVSDTVVAPVNADRYGETSVKLLDIRFTELKSVLVSPANQESLLTANLLFFINRFDQNKRISSQRYDAISNYQYESGILYGGYIPVREIFNRTLEYELGLVDFADMDIKSLDVTAKEKQRLKADKESALEVLPIFENFVNWVINQ